jgi:hypothetical protein
MGVSASAKTGLVKSMALCSEEYEEFMNVLFSFFTSFLLQFRTIASFDRVYPPSAPAHHPICLSPSFSPVPFHHHHPQAALSKAEDERRARWLVEEEARQRKLERIDQETTYRRLQQIGLMEQAVQSAWNERDHLRQTEWRRLVCVRVGVCGGVNVSANMNAWWFFAL